MQIKRQVIRRRRPEPEEAWAVVPAYEEIEVSTLGRVRHVATHKRVPSEHRGGGITKALIDGTWLKLSWLVAVCHVPNPDPENFTAVGFRDGNKRHRAAANLFWRRPEDEQRVTVVPPKKEGVV